MCLSTIQAVRVAFASYVWNNSFTMLVPQQARDLSVAVLSKQGRPFVLFPPLLYYSQANS